MIILALGDLINDTTRYNVIANILKICIGGFAIFLFTLSISAYRKTSLRKMIYAAIAFSIFAVQLLLEFLEDTITSLDKQASDVLFYAMTLSILVLFFLAIVRRK
jgi:hypothetical protein